MSVSGTESGKLRNQIGAGAGKLFRVRFIIVLHKLLKQFRKAGLIRHTCTTFPVFYHIDAGNKEKV